MSKYGHFWLRIWLKSVSSFKRCFPVQKCFRSNSAGPANALFERGNTILNGNVLKENTFRLENTNTLFPDALYCIPPTLCTPLPPVRSVYSRHLGEVKNYTCGGSKRIYIWYLSDHREEHFQPSCFCYVPLLRTSRQLKSAKWSFLTFYIPFEQSTQLSEEPSVRTECKGSATWRLRI